MNETALWLPALLLSLFCLIYSIVSRRELYFPMPKGLIAKARNQHAVFLAMLVALIAAEAAGAAAGASGAIRAAGVALRALLFCLFALYISALPGAERKKAAFLAAVAATGVAIRLIWAAPVELFFAAVSAFGCMVMLERDRDAAESGMSDRFRLTNMVAVALTFLMVIGMDVSQIQSLSRTQSDELGRIQLDIIRSDLQDTLASAEANLLHIAIRAERLIDASATRESIEHFILDQRESLLADESFMNVYIAGSDWHVVPGFDAPPDFHASERVCYIGAAEHPGEVYITEPYKDADTGGMCFTISTLLSDGETVVAMDLNFSKVQESIREMTTDKDETAMIVTDSGLIVGYTDMSLVGESADEKLPEYSQVLRRVTASQAHDSFRVTLDGRSRVIFSSETSNRWYLILSVGADALYAQSRRQIATIASVNLLMLVVVGVFYLLSTRNRLRAALVVQKNRRFIDDFADRLRVLTGRVQRLGDARLIRENDDPAILAGHIRESGEQLSELAGEIQSYSEVLRENIEAEEAQKPRRQDDGARTPTRAVRSGVIAVLLAALVIVSFFCVRISANWGDTRLNREADRYENQLGAWITEQTSILYMFTDTISAQPEIMDDYDTAVRWLNSIARKYPDISACYMANPYAKIPVIMNTGWIPGDDFRPETRPWYRATERAPNHFSISAPYFDAQTGNYCITFSRVVYSESDEFLGIFGIDFFLDKLMQVLGESYTSTGYAFLVDSAGVIINHPNDAYQNANGEGVSIEDTEYAEAYSREGITALRDYSGHLVSCLTRETDSGFTVAVAIRWWSIYGSTVLVMAAFIALFGAYIAFIVWLINRLIRWQSGVNQQLVAAVTAAQNADRAKSQFLSQMSHEIRTPMNAIIGLDSIALRDPDLSPHTRDELEKIGASAKHLLALINDILDMSRIESGRMELKDKRFSLKELLNQINVIVGGQCEEKRLRYECHVPQPHDDGFVGDDLKLKQVLINILGNSVKFTEAPGSVLPNVAQTDTGDGACRMRFTISDTGIDMDKAFLDKLFDAFSQEDDTTTNKYGGSGLGMAITKRMVDMMGGEIQVESEKGVGSTFTVTIPLQKTAEEAAAPEAAPAQPLVACAPVAGLHVLIAEDQEMNAEVLADLLEMEEISSEWAENGQIAVEMFAQSGENHFDAILMDMRMPVMDGLAATREIRGLDRPDAGTVPIIALTANAFEEDVQQCLQAGMNEYLSKPVGIDALVLALGKLVAAGKTSAE